MDIIVIGGRGHSKIAIIEAVSRVMKTDLSVYVAIHHLSSCTEICCEEVEESVKKIQDAFLFSGSTDINLKKSFDEFIESIEDFKLKPSFEPAQSKFFSKPKNNFKTR